MRRTRFALAALLVSAVPAAAYEPGGHYFTVGAILTQLADKDLRKAVICTQLPDESSELDAIAQVKAHKFATLGFILFGAHKDDLPRVLAVHQLLHGLNGQPAAQLQTAAQAIVTELFRRAQLSHQADDYCALGFGLHLYGDAFAHRQLDHPDLMYGPVLGHASGGTHPDKALNQPEAESPWHLTNWQRYAASVAQITGSPAQALEANVFEPARALVALEPEVGIDETETRLRSVLQQQIARQSQWQAPAFTGLAPCQEVVQRMPDVAGVSCLGAWAAYKAVALEKLAPLNHTGVAFFDSKEELP